MADRIKGIVGIAALVAVIAGVVFLAQQDWGSVLNPRTAVDTALSSSDTAADPADTSRRSFTVRKGDSATAISERLQSEGLIKNALAFRLMAESKGVAGELAVGEYEF